MKGTTPKKKGRKGSRKKSGKRRGFFLAVLIGLGLSVLFLFRQEITDLLSFKEPKRTVSKAKQKQREKQREKGREKEPGRETGSEGEKEQKNIVLYFSDEDEVYLVGERGRISKRDKMEEEAKELLGQLIRGPKGNLIPTLPPQTKLLALRLKEGGVAQVDFSRSLSANHPGGSSAEMMTVYSVVNSLASNFPQIKQVQILIEGKEVETIAGHLSLKKPLPLKPDLIKKDGKDLQNH